MKSEKEFLEFICPEEYIEGENETSNNEDWIRDRILERLKEVSE